MENVARLERGYQTSQVCYCDDGSPQSPTATVELRKIVSGSKEGVRVKEYNLLPTAQPRWLTELFEHQRAESRNSHSLGVPI